MKFVELAHTMALTHVRDDGRKEVVCMFPLDEYQFLTGQNKGPSYNYLKSEKPTENDWTDTLGDEDSLFNK